MVVPFGEDVYQTIQASGVFVPLLGLRIQLGYALWKPEISR